MSPCCGRWLYTGLRLFCFVYLYAIPHFKPLSPCLNLPVTELDGEVVLWEEGAHEPEQAEPDAHQEHEHQIAEQQEAST